ncbi:D-isomer specific 2-hydroxyacid dehydrogenase family protein [Mycolicibacterium tokaiense]|uniref:D-isomer specific 2-hydroxyacid dehydrogenase n=1 Tax=Mycolicibacterium tokaiense TaxID=39695 RepID=A0A378TJK1_9MYCO|nr:D-isomer specific 2-hydroxyacid dehydrogenase family protein [Mycolicibacterium tokaiense]BBY85760.1 dihydrofolate reductase [Mycolicibacterium tokaiense]STZ59726.1 D-isomer specific 2-hydroxyacid dehydrogenase [Mycolicibacterium tokaiense]
MNAVAVHVGPTPLPPLVAAVEAAGATVSDDPAGADVVVWRGSDHRRLGQVLEQGPQVRWVQLGAAGTDAWAPTGMFDDGRMWTSAKGAYSEAVAEHALALTFALTRGLARYARATTWTGAQGRNLYGSTVLLLGARGGIGREFIRLVEPFKARILAAGRGGVTDMSTGKPMVREAAIEQADIVMVAAPLTPSTRGLISREWLDLMAPTAILVNVGRGAIVDTAALVEALQEGRIGGAALDVTDPEPLPDGHPLWTLDNCLITPHSANPLDMLMPQLVHRVTDNLIRFAEGRPLVGVVDPAKGY